MSHIRFNQLFILLMVLGLAGALAIPASVTDRAKGKEDLLLYPIVKPIRGIAAIFQRKYGHKTLPPGETAPRLEGDVMAENTVLRQDVISLRKQLEELRLVESERKNLGPLLDYFKPVSVLNNDATPGRESLGIGLAAGVDTGN